MPVSVEACSVTNGESLCAYRGLEFPVYFVTFLWNVLICCCYDIVVYTLYGVVYFCVVSTVKLCGLVCGS